MPANSVPLLATIQPKSSAMQQKQHIHQAVKFSWIQEDGRAKH